MREKAIDNTALVFLLIVVTGLNLKSGRNRFLPAETQHAVRQCIPTLLHTFQRTCLGVPSSYAPWNNFQICAMCISFIATCIITYVHTAKA